MKKPLVKVNTYKLLSLLVCSEQPRRASNEPFHVSNRALTCLGNPPILSRPRAEHVSKNAHLLAQSSIIAKNCLRNPGTEP